jgi:hypothetical protein
MELSFGLSLRPTDQQRPSCYRAITEELPADFGRQVLSWSEIDMTGKENRPKHEIRLGRVKASIWENPGRQNGIVQYGVTVAKVYRDGDLWKTTTTFWPDDLPLLVKVADQAFIWTYLKGKVGK